MFEIIIGTGLVFFFTWLDARSRGLTVFGNQRALPPLPSCRACGEQLPEDPFFHCKLIDDTVVCEACKDEIDLEVGLTYPSWWHQPLPAEQETKFGVLESVPTEEGRRVAEEVQPEERYYICALCDEKHQMDQICMKEMIRVSTCEKCGRVTCVCDKSPPGDLVDWTVRTNWACENPRMNAVIVNPDMGPCLKAVASLDVKYCESCRVDHRGHEKCPDEERGHNCHYCAKPIRSKGLCDRCILWGPPGEGLFGEPCKCTYYHDESEAHPEVFTKAFADGKVYEFVQRRISEGYGRERRR